MALNGDAENQTNSASNEQTPLLDDNHQSDPQPDQQPEQNGHERKQTSWYVWGVFWAIVAALVLAVFIKGWIDAGSDVNVSNWVPRLVRNLSVQLISDS